MGRLYGEDCPQCSPLKDVIEIKGIYKNGKNPFAKNDGITKPLCKGKVIESNRKELCWDFN